MTNILRYFEKLVGRQANAKDIQISRYVFLIIFSALSLHLCCDSTGKIHVGGHVRFRGIMQLSLAPVVYFSTHGIIRSSVN